MKKKRPKSDIFEKKKKKRKRKKKSEQKVKKKKKKEKEEKVVKRIKKKKRKRTETDNKFLETLEWACTHRELDIINFSISKKQIKKKPAFLNPCKIYSMETSRFNKNPAG